uniref:Uncharacterized protein n=2 Tax=Oryza sativa subsp. japonica TaxID=39947 RepID=Q53JC1_ORYSJ|nr:hypothetical protein [Oryza sativa Japonica Group]AAX96714.1 hypothetical protein [Oryza sativa Japonica Group]ABA93037.1 hypothetical protein LOC_Os11g21930 [Oryza sativa Japonica Group]
MCAYALTASSPASSPVGHELLLPGSTAAAELRRSAVPRAIIVTSPSSEAPPKEVTVDMPSRGLSLRFF